MSLNVKKSNVSESEISSEIKLGLPDGLPKKELNKIKDEAGELLVDAILSSVGKATSPIQGESWPALTKEYKSFKQKQGAGSKANMELTGDMLDSLGFSRTKDGVKIGITGFQAPKADGHNNFSGKSELPRRRFLPVKGDKFKGSVEKDIKGIIADAVAKNARIKKRELNKIGSKRELNSFIKESFKGVTIAEAKDAILLDDDLREQFTDILDLF